MGGPFGVNRISLTTTYPLRQPFARSFLLAAAPRVSDSVSGLANAARSLLVRQRHSVLKRILDRFPRLKVILKSVFYRLQGLPPISHSKISKDLIRECVDKESPTILEIGCNDGGHSLWFLEMFESPEIYCFEPDPRAIERFKRKVGQRSKINLFEIALCDHNGEVDFYQSGGHRNKKETKARPEEWDLSGSIR